MEMTQEKDINKEIVRWASTMKYSILSSLFLVVQITERVKVSYTMTCVGSECTIK